MKIAIVGAGIVGTTTAYELAQDGHAVTVFEQRSAAAEEASFATGGLLAPGVLSPWSAPGTSPAPTYTGRQATLRLGSALTLAELSWLRRWRRAARACARSGEPLPPLVTLERLARYSHARLLHLTESLDLQFERSTGTLILLRSARDAEALTPALKALRDAGNTLREVDAETARAIEPGLSPALPLTGALHVPDGLAGNCRQFALLLRQAAQHHGAQFHFNTRVARLTSQPAGVQVDGETSPRTFDAVVLCAGAQSAALLQPLGLRLPLVVLHGSSVSAPLRDELHAPLGVVVDMHTQTTITRLGQRVRVSGGAELGRKALQAHPQTLNTLYRVLGECFPGGVSHSSGLQVWRGARPMLPDGPPAVGATEVPGLWLNLGHGASGWSLACGSARALADQMTGKTPDISLDGLGAQRF
ncbi:MAG: FAD-dependent oxidoreductase [Giesbergeria sp.]|jgi:D-amino-acid dehydrogenase|nr:FAD-dependent oxidoreductase [Giesbergeria sp.]